MAAHDSPRPARLSLRGAASIAAALLLTQIGISFGLPRPDELRALLTDVLAPVVSLSAAACLLYAAYRQPHERLAWAVLAAALFCSAAGDLTWLLLTAVLHVEPFPSIADVFYIAFYPLFALGLILLPVTSRAPSERLRQVVDIGIGMLAGVVLVWSILLEPALSVGRSGQQVQILSAAYPVGDIVVLFGSVWLLFGWREPPRADRFRPLLFLTGGAAVFILADVLFGIQAVQATFRSGTLIDVLWVAGYALFGLAGVQAAGRPGNLSESSGLGTGERLPWAIYAPYLLLGTAYLLVLWQRSTRAAQTTAGEFNALAAIIGLVLVRQLIELRRAAQLLRSEQHQRAQLAVLHTLALEATQASTVDALLQRATEVLAHSLYPANVGVLLVEESSGDLVVHASYRETLTDTAVERVPAGKGIVGEVARSGLPRRLGDVSRDPAYIAASARARSELAVPIIAGEVILGVLNTESDRLNAFTEADEQLLKTIAGQMATAIVKLRLFESGRQRIQALTALHATSLDLSAQLNLADLLKIIVTRAAGLLAATSGGLYLMRPEDHAVELVVSHNYPPDAAQMRLKLGEGLAGRVAVSGEAMVVDNYMLWSGRAETFRNASWRSRLGVPIKWQGEVIGVLNLGHDQANRFNGADLELAGLFADQAAVAIANARLFSEAQRRSRELASLYDTAGTAASVADADQLLTQLAGQMTALLNPDTVAVTLFHSDTMEVEVALGIENGERLGGFERLPVDAAGLTGWIIRNGRPLLFGDLAADPLPAPPIHRGQPARSWLGVPLMAHDRALGVISVQSFQPHKFTHEDARLLESLAGQVSIALENARLYEALADEKRRLELLYDLSQNLTATLNSREVARRALDQVCEAIGTFKGAVFVLEPATDLLRLVAARGFSDMSPEELDAQVNLRVGSGLAGWAAAERAVAVAEDVQQDPRWRTVPGVDDWVRASISLPLIAGDELVGVMSLHSDKPRSISYEQTLFLTAASASVAVALQNARLFAAEARRALDLTLLNNMTRTAVEISDFSELLRTLDSRLSELLQADAAFITLWDDERQRPLLRAGEEAARAADGRGGLTAGELALTESVMRSGHALTAEDTANSVYISRRAAERLEFKSILALPLLAGSRKLGAALVCYRRPHTFTREEIVRGEQAAGQIALGIAKARLLDDARRSADESQAVSDILRALNEVPEVTQAFDAIAAGLKKISGADRVSLALLDATRENFLISAIDHPRPEINQGTRLPVTATAAAGDVLAGRIHVTSDLSTEQQFPVEKALFEAGYRSRLNLPLRVGDIAIGALNLVWSRTEGFAGGNLALFEQIADALALAVEKNRLFAETQRRADELAVLAEVSSALRAASVSEEMVPILLNTAAEIVGARFYAVYLFEPQTGELVLRASQPPDPALVGQRQRLGEGIVGRVAQTGTVYVHTDPLNDPQARYLRGEAEHWAEISTSITLPLRSQDQIVGVLDMGLGSDHPALGREVNLLTAIAEIAGNALHRATVLETLEQRVAHRTLELASANAKLKELDQLKNRFVSNVSHELRTPLTNIKLHLGLLAKRGPELLGRYLPILQRETERLHRLIEDLLDLSRLQSESAPPAHEPQLLDLLLAEVLAAYAPTAEGKGQVVRPVSAAKLPAVAGDRAQLIQVFTNLLGNAVAYTPRGGHITVTLSPETYAGRPGAAAVIHNDGPAVPAEDLPHLFERFYRGQTGHESGEPGTGLGLAISKDIVDRHGGHISAQSSAEAGTSFIVWLPAM